MAISSFDRPFNFSGLFKMVCLTLFKVINTIFVPIKLLLFKLFCISIVLLVQLLPLFITKLHLIRWLSSYVEGLLLAYLLFLVIWGPDCWVADIILIIINYVFRVSYGGVAFVFLFLPWGLPLSLMINHRVCLSNIVLAVGRLLIAHLLLVVLG